MSHQNCECQKSKTKLGKVFAKSICTMKLKAKKLKAKEADIETANVTTADINTLNVSNIVVDGKDLTCALQA